MEKFGRLQFGLDYYTEVFDPMINDPIPTLCQVLDLEYLLETFPEDAFTAKYKQLNTALTGLVSDYRYFTRIITLHLHHLSNDNWKNMSALQFGEFPPGDSQKQGKDVGCKSNYRQGKWVRFKTIDKANG